MIVELVRAGLASEDGGALTERLARMRQERQESIDEAMSEAGFVRRPLMRRAAEAVLAWMPMREAPKHNIMLAFLRSRQAALELGRRLHGRGGLDAPAEVFYLDIEELQQSVQNGRTAPDVIGQRRRELKRWMGTQAPAIIRSDGVPVDLGVGRLDTEGLSGHGIGGGIAVGPVKILDEPDPRAVADGDVLVVTFADPGWTPLFPRASAVVMEVGGTMCHAAVVARELGVPAVFAVKDAKTLLADGEIVRVDGDAGRVDRVAEDRE